MQLPECPVLAAIVFVSSYKFFLVDLGDCYCLTPIIIRECSYYPLTPLALTLFLHFSMFSELLWERFDGDIPYRALCSKVSLFA